MTEPTIAKWPRLARPTPEIESIRDNLLARRPFDRGVLLGRYDARVIYALMLMVGDHEPHLRTLWNAITVELAEENAADGGRDFNLDPADIVERFVKRLIDLSIQNAEISSPKERELIQKAAWTTFHLPRSAE